MNIIKTSDETYIAAKTILEGQINEAASVFVLIGLMNLYSRPFQVLGVYNTKSAAEKARDMYVKNHAFDKYSIEEHQLV